MAEKAAKARQDRLVELESSRYSRGLKDSTAAAKAKQSNAIALLEKKSSLDIKLNNITKSKASDNSKIKRARLYQKEVLKMKQKKDASMNKLYAEYDKGSMSPEALQNQIKRITKQFKTNGDYLNGTYSDILAATPPDPMPPSPEPTLEMPPLSGLLNQPSPLSLSDTPTPAVVPSPELPQKGYGRGRNYTTTLYQPTNNHPSPTPHGRNHVNRN